MNAARIGTALCQLSVFRPPTQIQHGGASLTPHPPDPENPMETVYLRGLLESTRAQAATQKKEMDVELKAALAETTTSNVKLTVYMALVRKLESKIRAERILHHTAKNAMAEAQGAIELYIDEHTQNTPGNQHSESLATLRVASETLQHGLRIIWRSLQIASIFEGSYTAKAEVVGDLGEWARLTAPLGMSVSGEEGAFEFAEPVCAELFRCLAYDNVLSHGAEKGKAMFHSEFDAKDGRILCLSVRNEVLSAVVPSATRRRSLSTGLGLGDLRDVCKLRGVQVESALDGEGLWCATLRLHVSRVLCKRSGESAETEAAAAAADFAQCPPKHVAVIDDMPSILRRVSHTHQGVARQAHGLDSQPGEGLGHRAR